MAETDDIRELLDRAKASLPVCPECGCEELFVIYEVPLYVTVANGKVTKAEMVNLKENANLYGVRCRRAISLTETEQSLGIGLCTYDIDISAGEPYDDAQGYRDAVFSSAAYKAADSQHWPRWEFDYPTH